MRFHGHFIGHSLATKWTKVLLNIKMTLLMRLEILSCFERGVTIFTDFTTFLTVDASLMKLESSPTRERFDAHVTRERTFSRVSPYMHLHISDFWCIIFAMCALEESLA
jgi:hypothetical protein